MRILRKSARWFAPITKHRLRNALGGLVKAVGTTFCILLKNGLRNALGHLYKAVEKTFSEIL